jgi:hypothetical protein
MSLDTQAGAPDVERRSQRRYAAGGLEGVLPGGQAIEVLDLSPGGLSVATAERLLVEHNYELRLGYRKREIHLPCRVAWCRPADSEGGGDPSSFVAGLALRRQMSKETRELLETFQQLAATTLTTRIHGRAEMQLKSDPDNRRWCNIEVRRISQKGLFCELGVEPLAFKPFEIEVPLGDVTLRAEARLTAPAEKDPETPGLYRGGLEFRNLSGKARKILADYMAAQLAAIRPSATAHRTD